MIKIYDIVTQKCDITIQREKNSHCMCAQLDNGSIVSWEEKKKMIIYSITKDSYKKEFETPNLHEKNYFQKMIDLSENRLATCSESQEVKITLPLLDQIPLMEYPIIYDYDEERLIIEGNNEYLLVNITTEEVEKKIDIKKLNINVGELFILRDKKTIVGRKNSSKKEYILFTFEDGITNRFIADQRGSYLLALIDDNTFVSSVSMILPDINVWKY